MLYAWPGFCFFCPPILIFLYIYILFSVFYQLLVRKREPGTFLMLLPSSSLQVLWQFSCTPVTYATISLYAPHIHSLCSLLLEVPSDCFRPLLHPASDQKQARNKWVDLFLPRVRHDGDLFKTLRIESYLTPHLILLGNDTIWGLLSWFSFLSLSILLTWDYRHVYVAVIGVSRHLQ